MRVKTLPRPQSRVVTIGVSDCTP